ncbi:hypothetical protein RDI58_011086 [Solanum bulbocastanum]|uniref:Uncharacterized protein n=1 Tax=Solanum bulbocastanum TaxID=147425 RepID=A0AAN8TQG1_SOLBU
MQMDAIKHEEVEPASSLDGSQSTLVDEEDKATDVEEETVNVQLAVLWILFSSHAAYGNELLSLGAYHLRYCQMIREFRYDSMGNIETPTKEGAEQF